MAVIKYMLEHPTKYMTEAVKTHKFLGKIHLTIKNNIFNFKKVLNCNDINCMKLNILAIETAYDYKRYFDQTSEQIIESERDHKYIQWYAKLFLHAEYPDQRRIAEDAGNQYEYQIDAYKFELHAAVCHVFESYNCNIPIQTNGLGEFGGVEQNMVGIFKIHFLQKNYTNLLNDDFYLEPNKKEPAKYYRNISNDKFL